MATTFPTTQDTAASLFDAVNNATSTLSGGHTAGGTTIDLVSASLFPSTGGVIYVGNERTTYTGKTANQLTGMAVLSNNYSSGTVVAMYVDAEHHNVLRGAVVAVEARVGVTGDTTAGTLTKRIADLEAGSASVEAQIHAAASKLTPADADEFGLADSAGAWALKKTTWSEIKATIKSYYDSVAATLTNKTLTTPGITGGSFKYTLTGGSLAADRILNVPVTTATDTLSTLGLAQTWTAAQTFRAASAVRSESASTQDAMVLAGRAGGSSSYAVTLTPTTLTGSRTVTFPDAATSIPVASYTYTISGPSAARTYTLPDANASLAILGANTFTGNQALGDNNLTGIKTASFTAEGTISGTTGAQTVDWTAAQNYKQTEPTGAITYTFTAPAGVCHLQLRILSDGTSTAYTHVWPASVKWLGATWAAATNKNAVINFWYDGTSYWAMGANEV